jgi:hypothetical protein
MTKENGKVVVSSQVPGIGTVLGTKTLQELLAGGAPAEAAKKDEPAVVTRPLATAAK